MSGKWEVKKEALYRPGKGKPEIVDVPTMIYIAVDGVGDPGSSEDFARALEALYAISYGIRMLPKKGPAPRGYFEYTVAPLEGFWDMATDRDFTVDRKEELAWTVMIRQPGFVDGSLFESVRDTVAEKKKSAGNPKIMETRLQEINEGLCCQILHVGPFDDEPLSFALMDSFIETEGYRRQGHAHHEIYLSDFRRTAPEKLRTILRYPILKEV